MATNEGKATPGGGNAAPANSQAKQASPNERAANTAQKPTTGATAPLPPTRQHSGTPPKDQPSTQGPPTTQRQSAPAANKSPGPDRPASLREIVEQWADGLRPNEAPRQERQGPLAWVRDVKVPELLRALEKAGHK